MNSAVILFGKIVKLAGKLIGLLAALCTWLMILSMLGLAYKLINTMIPDWAYWVMFQEGIISDLFVWYYAHVYSMFPAVQVITYYITNWGGAVLIVLFRVLHNVLNFLSNKITNAGIHIVNRGLAGKAKQAAGQNNALIQELDRQAQLNQQLRQENAWLKSRKSAQPKPHKIRDSVSNYFRTIRQREEQAAANQEDAWGKWSRRK